MVAALVVTLLGVAPVRADSAAAGPPPNPMPAASVSTTRLDNGLQVVARRDAVAPLVTVDLWVSAGAAADGGTGAAHALEHMIFKGSDGIAAGAVDAEVEAAGGILYAETLADATHYWAAVPSDRVGDALTALARLMRPPAVPAADWDRERAVMLEEIARSRTDAPAELRRDLLRRLFGPVYGAPVAGTPEALAALTPEAIRSFFTRHYRPDAMTLVVVGPVSASDVQAAAAGTLGKMAARTNRPAIVPAPVALEKHVEGVRVGDGRVEVGMAFPAPDGAAVDVLATILAARLGVLTAGVADRVEVSHPWQRAGVLMLAAGGPAANEAALRAALREVAAGAEDGITLESVASARRRRRWSWWLGHEKASDQTRALGLAAALGDIREAAEVPAHLDAVTPLTVRAAARVIFNNPSVRE